MRPLTRIFLSLCLLLGLINSATLPGQAQPLRSTQVAAETSQPNTGAGRYVPLATPIRMLDTLTGIGVPAMQSMPSQTPVPVKFTGRNGIPATGVTALQLNIVTGNTSKSGTIFAWPKEEVRPASPNFYFYINTGFTSSTSIVRLGASGEINFLNASTGTMRILGDVTGYYTGEDSQVAGTRFVPLKQTRLIDTRNKVGVTTNTPVPANGTIPPVAIASKGGLPAATGIASVAVSITAWSPVAGGGWIAFPGGATAPAAYYGNFSPGKPYTNTGVVKLSSDGKLALKNVSSGTTHFTVDVVGYFINDTSPAAKSLRTVPIPMQRLVDTGASSLVAPNNATTVQASGKAGIPSDGVLFAALRVTAIGAATSGDVVAYPANEPRLTGVTDVAQPISSTVSYNLIWARVSPTGTVNIMNGTNAGLRFYVDVVAYAISPGKPETPTKLAGGSRDGAVEVHWDAPIVTGDLPIAGYDVIAAPGSKTASSTSTSVVMTGLTNGKEYTFRVRARTMSGASAYTSPSDPVVPNAPKPPGPPFITNTIARDSGARVTWVAPQGAVDQVASYEISTIPATTIVTVAGDVKTADVYGMTNGQTYSVVVTAKNANGASPSAGEKVTPELGKVPMEPAAFVTYPLNERIDLQWVEPADGGSSVLDYEVTAEPGSHRLVIPGGTTVAALTGLTNGTDYAVKVRARTKVGSGAWVEATVAPIASRAPDAPTDLQVSPTSPGVFKVAWEAPDDVGTSAITGYRVTVTPGGRVVESTGKSVDVDGLDPETEYTLTAQAMNTAGASAASAPSRPLRPVVSTKKAPVVLSADSLGRIAAVGADNIAFSSPNAQISAVKKDDIVLASVSPATPGGLLRKVLRVDDLGSLLVLQTQDAALDEILSDGAMTRELRMHSSNVQSLTGGEAGATLKRPTINGRSMKDGARFGSQAAGKVGRVTLRGSVVVVNLEGDFSDFLHLEGSAEADPRTDFQFKVGSGGVSSLFRATADIKLSTRVDLAVSKGFERRILLGTVNTLPIVVPIGGAPVVLIPEASVYLAWDSEGRAGLTFQSTVKRRLGVGLNYNEGSGQPSIDPINEDVEPFTVTEAKFFGSSENLVGLELETAIMVYGTLGPTLNIRPYVRIEADTTNDPFVEVFYGVQVGAGLRLDFLKMNLVRWVKPDIIQFERSGWQSSGRFIGLMIEPGGAELARDEQLQFKTRLFAYPDGPPTWSATGPGRITSDGTFTADADGTARVKAVVPAGVGRPELTAEVSVSIGEHAPTQPRNLTAVPGNLAAFVSWEPPEHLGGRPVDKYVVTSVPDTGVHEVSGAARSATITGLWAGSKYIVSVYAVTSNGRGDAASAVQITARPSMLANPGANDVMAGLQGSTNSIGAELSDTGRYAIFPLSVAPDQTPPPGVPADGNFYLVRRDLATGQVELVSRQTDGATPQIISGPLSEDEPSSRRVQPDIASSGDGRHVAYIVDDGARRRRVVVRDVAQNTSWSAVAGVPEMVRKISLSGDASTLSIDTFGDETGGHKKVFLVKKGVAAKRVDMCTADIVCDAASSVGLSADGNIVYYFFGTRNTQSQYYNDLNLFVAYNASSGAHEKPYYENGSLQIVQAEMSRNGQYLVAAVWLGPPWEPTERAFLTKRVGTGPIVAGDIFEDGYAFTAVGGFPLAISDDGKVVAWSPGYKKDEETPPPPGTFTVTNLLTGVNTRVSDPPLVLGFAGWTGTTMASDGSMVGWKPNTLGGPVPGNPVVHRLK